MAQLPVATLSTRTAARKRIQDKRVLCLIQTVTMYIGEVSENERKGSPGYEADTLVHLTPQAISVV